MLQNLIAMWLQGRVGARSLINYDEDERKEQATVIKGGFMSAVRRVQAQIYVRTLHYPSWFK